MADVTKRVNYVWSTSGADQVAGGMKSIAIQAALVAAAYKAVTAAQDFLVSSTQAAIDANEDWNKFMVVMGDSAQQVSAELETFADATNNSVYELRQLAAGVQDMLVPMGVARDEAAELSTNFVQLATNMASFNNVPVAEVLNAIQSGLAGQSRPLRRFGVDTRVAALEAQALAMGINASWQEMTQAQQAQVLYAKVVADTADAQGDAARTADEAAGVLRGLRTSFQDAKVEVGNQFLPVIEELVPDLKELGEKALPIVVEIVNRLADDIRKYGPPAIEVLSALVDVAGWLSDNFELMDTSWRIFAASFTGGGSEVLRFLIDQFADAVNEADALAEKMRQLDDHVIRNRLENYEYAASLKGVTEEQIRFNDEIGKAIQLYKWDSDAKIEMGIATGEAAIAQLELLAATSGGLVVFDASIARIQAQIDKLHTLSKTTGEIAVDLSSLDGVSTGGGTARTPDEETGKQIEERTLRMLEFRQRMEDETAMIEEARIERTAEFERRSIEERAAVYRSLAQDTAGFITTAFTDGFDSALDAFGDFLKRAAAEYAGSELLSLFGAAGKGATGGILGFLL